MSEQPATFKYRGDTAANWSTRNPILLSREPGLLLDSDGNTINLKFGNGVDHWNDLDYVLSQSVDLTDVAKLNEENIFTEKNTSRVDVPVYTLADVGDGTAEFTKFSVLEPKFGTSNAFEVASLMAVALDADFGDGVQHIRQSGLVVNKWNPQAGEFDGGAGVILYNYQGQTDEGEPRWGFDLLDAATADLPGLFQASKANLSVGVPTDESHATNKLYVDESIATATSGALNQAALDNAVSGLEGDLNDLISTAIGSEQVARDAAIAVSTASQAGKSLYSGEYEGADLEGGPDQTITLGANSYTMRLVQTQGPDEWYTGEPEKIHFKALTAKTRLVLQSVVWCKGSTTLPADNELAPTSGAGGTMSWQIGNVDTNDFPHGNAIFVAGGATERIKRQLEIVITTVPGQDYEYDWLFNQNDCYLYVGSRHSTTCNIFSA